MTTKRNLGIIGAILGAAGIATVAALRQSLPQTRGKLTIDALQQPVEVLRDQWGVPHIYAQNTHDLFVAQGFVHAQDRLWQMESQRRLGAGRLAEIIGSRAIDTDRYMRILGLARSAKANAAQLAPDTRAAIQAYCDGINAFVRQHQHRLPPEFVILRHTPEPWTVEDVLVWGKIMALSLSGNWNVEVLRARLIAAIGETAAGQYEAMVRPDLPLIVPPGTEYRSDIGASALAMAEAANEWMKSSENNGSNNWVVSGAHTSTGLPLLANDPHLGLQLPSIWYEIHLHAPDYHVAGASFVGVPCVIIGHNERIAWGVTNGMNDVQDLYIERFDDNDPAGLRYQYKGDWHHAELIYETINVKGSAAVIEPVRITHHGPIITPLIRNDGSRESQPLALRWTALDSTTTLVESILELNRAHNWESFRAALSKWDVPPQNFVYADVEGHIGYQLAGHIPLRPNSTGRVPVPGWSGEYDWAGYVAFAQLPARFDPAGGRIVTANNQIVSADYSPAMYGEWSNGWRAARIEHLLHQHDRHDASTFAAIHGDQCNLAGIEAVALAGRIPDGDALSNQARALFSAWDGQLTVDSIAATVGVQFLEELKLAAFAPVRALMAENYGMGAFVGQPGRDYMNRALPRLLLAARNNDLSWFRDGRTWDDVIAQAWQSAMSTIRKRLGDNPARWQYGSWHQVHFKHPLGAIPLVGRLFNRGAHPLGGNRDTVNMGDISTSVTGVTTYTTPSIRLICDTADWERSKSMHPGGQSGHPLSAHYSDFIKPWLNVEYHPMPWHRRRVEEVCSDTLVLTP